MWKEDMKQIMSMIDVCDSLLKEPYISDAQRQFYRMVRQNERLKQIVKPYHYGSTVLKQRLYGVEPKEE